MNKSDFVKVLTQVFGQRREAEKAVDQFVLAMRTAMRKGEKVVLSGFGSFYPKIRKAQKRYNPKTREPVQVPPKRMVKFTASEDLFK